jgi:hypothetical protein
VAAAGACGRSGGRCGVPVELEEVVRGRDEAPFRPDGGSSPASEAVQPPRVQVAQGHGDRSRARGRCTRDTYLGAQYRRIRARRGANRASLAVAHSLLVAVWHMLTTGETYTDPGADYYTRRDPARATRRLIAQLERLGHTVTLQEGAAG